MSWRGCRWGSELRFDGWAGCAGGGVVLRVAGDGGDRGGGRCKFEFAVRRGRVHFVFMLRRWEVSLYCWVYVSLFCSRVCLPLPSRFFFTQDLITWALWRFSASGVIFYLV